MKQTWQVRALTGTLSGMLLAIAIPALGQSVRFEGARVYRDGAFVDATLSTRRGVVISDNDVAGPGETTETVSLAGKFVLPAFGDVHTHRFTEEDADAKELYLSAGFLYIHNLNGTALSRTQAAKHTNNPSSPDVRFANAGFTCSGGHPIPLYTHLTTRDPSIEKDKVLQRIANYNFYITDSISDVNEKWPKFARSGADIVKLFLLHSERWKNDPAITNDKSDGLRPQVAREIADRARAAGLRIAAHVESAADATLAIDCGVALLAHMPGYGLRPDQDTVPFVVDDAVMRQAASRGMAVSPTLGLLYADPNKDPTGTQRIRNWKVEQVRRWKDAGVVLLYGSDNYFDVRSELRAMIESKVWTAPELVELLCVQTPRWICPGRSIAALKAGCEANFVVLSANPLDDPRALEQVDAVYKDGTRIWELKPADSGPKESVEGK